MAVVDAIHHLLHQMQTKTSGSALGERKTGVRLRRVGHDVKSRRVVVTQADRELVAIEAQTDPDAVASGGVVLHEVSEDLFHRQLGGEAQLRIDDRRGEEPAHELEDLRQRQDVAIERGGHLGHACAPRYCTHSMVMSSACGVSPTKRSTLSSTAGTTREGSELPQFSNTSHRRSILNNSSASFAASVTPSV